MDKYVVIGAGTNGCIPIKSLSDDLYKIIPINNGLNPPVFPSLNLPETKYTSLIEYYFTQEYVDKHLSPSK